jgi:hypothetical protein
MRPLLRLPGYFGAALAALILLASPPAARAQVQETILFEDDFEFGTLDPNFWTARPNVDGGNNGIVEPTSKFRATKTSASTAASSPS